MKGVLVVQEMTRSLEATKSDFVMSLKKREAVIDNVKLGWYIYLMLWGFTNLFHTHKHTE